MTGREGEEKRKRDEAGRPKLSYDDPRLERDRLEAERRTLDHTWANGRGLIAWISDTDHKAIGRRFLVTAFGFFTLGGILAGLMRIQLARPENTFLGPDLYNQIFTMHGTTMMFLFAVPVVLAMGVYLVPLMVGARGIAFPRMLNYGYWMFLFGGIFLFVMFFLNTGPDAGWFSYPPLAGPEFGYGKRVGCVGAAHHLHGSVGADRRHLSRRHHLQAADARHVAEPHAALRLGDAGACRSWSSSRCRRSSSPAPASFSIAWSAPTSTTRRRAATRCSGSICSGSSAIPRSTSSSCRRSG